MGLRNREFPRGLENISIGELLQFLNEIRSNSLEKRYCLYHHTSFFKWQIN